MIFLINFFPRYEECVKDTCGCNVGGDCECLCTAVSAYAHACTVAGINIEWRNQGLCGKGIEFLQQTRIF